MADKGSTAKRYAEAILELAVEGRNIDEWTASLDRVTAALTPETLRLLGAPTYPLDARRRALDAATEKELAGVRALLNTLLDGERLVLLPRIARAFHDLLDARAGIEKAVVVTAIRLSEAEQKKLVATLERSSGKKLRAGFEVDPTIMGGVVVRIGDHQVDGSVRTRLALLRDRVAQGA
jgi:F-type H+-transporting ATPase subunit delta